VPVVGRTDSVARPTRRNSEAAWLLGTGLLSVALSLAIRVVERGPYVSGWALVAPTQGSPPRLDAPGVGSRQRSLLSEPSLLASLLGL